MTHRANEVLCGISVIVSMQFTLLSLSLSLSLCCQVDQFELDSIPPIPLISQHPLFQPSITTCSYGCAFKNKPQLTCSFSQAVSHSLVHSLVHLFTCSLALSSKLDVQSPMRALRYHSISCNVLATQTHTSLLLNCSHISHTDAFSLTLDAHSYHITPHTHSHSLSHSHTYTYIHMLHAARCAWHPQLRQMDGRQFAKLTRDTNMLTATFTSIDTDIIFAKYEKNCFFRHLINHSLFFNESESSVGLSVL